MQTAGRRVDLIRKFSARMERRQNDFERGFIFEFWMRIDRNAATIVANGNGVIWFQLQLDPARVTRHGFVHRIVDDFGGEVVQSTLVRAADIPGRRRAVRDVSRTSMSLAEYFEASPDFLVD